MTSKFCKRVENSLISIDELSSRLHSPNIPSIFTNKEGLLQQYSTIKGTCGLIFAYVTGVTGEPTIEQIVVYK